jgi:hypothetical protein
MDDYPMKNRERWLPVFLFFLLFFCFFLFYSGVPGTDDEQLFASAAQSFSVTGRMTALQVYGNVRVHGYYGNIAPLHPLVASLVYQLARWLQTGGLQCFFLLSPFYVSLTAYLLARIAQKKGFSPSTIVVTILAFGFTTMVFPYTKTFFREPLAMLLLTASYFELDNSLIKDKGRSINFFHLSFSILFIVLAIWTKEFLIICVPPLFFFFFLGLKEGRQKRRRIDIHAKDKRFLWGLLLVFCFFFLVVVFKDASGRFSISYLNRLFSYIPLLSHNNFIQAFSGAFFSISKGFLVYSPVLFLLVLSPFIHTNKLNKMDFALAVIASMGVAALQAFFYDSEWWTFSWSTRFMLPVIPLWMIALFPVIEWMLAHRKKVFRVLLISLMVVGLMIQFGALLVSSADYTQFLWEHYHLRLSETNVVRFDAIPAIGHWLVTFRGAPIDIAWVRILLAGHVSAIWLPVLLFLGCLLIAWNIRNWEKLTLKMKRLFFLAIFLFSLFLPVLILESDRADPYYGGNQLAYQAFVESIDGKVTRDDLLLVGIYNQPLWYYFFNFAFPRLTWMSLPPPHLTMNSINAIYPDMAETIAFIVKLKPSFQKIWLVSEKPEIPEVLDYEIALQQSGLKEQSQKIYFQSGQYPFLKLMEFS